MTRRSNYNRGAKDFSQSGVPLIALQTKVMGKDVEVSRNNARAFGEALRTGSARMLQSAASFAVQVGDYLKQQPHAFAHIAEQICKGPKQTP